MANKYMRRYVKSLMTREVQIKTTMRYHLTPVRWLLSKGQGIISVGEEAEKGTLVRRWWDCKLVQPPWKTVWRFLKNDKYIHHMIQDSTSECLSKENKNPNSKRHVVPHVYCSKTQKQPKCPSMDECIKKL